MKQNKNKENSQPSLGVSLAIIIFMAACFVYQLVVAGEPDVHMTLVFTIAFATILLLISGTKYEVIEEGVIHGCKIATISMMILMFIGVMIASWIAAGTIPSLIYYGLQIISPSVFLLTAVIICSISTLCTGTSWGTAATFGVALMGIGGGLGVPPAMTAGAIISGALFGDKLSPISDTVNLSSGACEVNLFDHIKSVFYTTIPSYVITLVAFTVMGFKFSKGSIDDQQVESVLSTISANFNVTPAFALLSMLPLILVLFLALRKKSALATMVAASLAGMIIAMIVNRYNIFDMMSIMNYGFTIDSGNADVDKLLNRGGLQSMMWTVSLGYLGLSFGGILEKSGVMHTLLYSIKAVTKNVRNLVISQTIAGFITIALSASPYVAILIPGRMFVDGYKKLGIKKTVCSRTCETSGICLDPLLPWTLGGVYYAGVLGVSPLQYAPYAILLWVVPIIAVVYACLGVFVWKEDDPNAGGGDSNPGEPAKLDAEAADIAADIEKL